MPIRFSQSRIILQSLPTLPTCSFDQIAPPIEARLLPALWHIARESTSSTKSLQRWVSFSLFASWSDPAHSKFRIRFAAQRHAKAWQLGRCSVDNGTHTGLLSSVQADFALLADRRMVQTNKGWAESIHVKVRTIEDGPKMNNVRRRFAESRRLKIASIIGLLAAVLRSDDALGHPRE